MAIRPADLQLAYLAAPANSAVASQAQSGPQIAQQAAAAAFAAQVREREETVAEAAKLEGNLVRPRGDEPQERETPEQRERREARGEAAATGLGLAGDGEHFIDVTA
jgi:hypothetical protein